MEGVPQVEGDSGSSVAMVLHTDGTVLVHNNPLLPSLLSSLINPISHPIQRHQQMRIIPSGKRHVASIPTHAYVTFFVVSGVMFDIENIAPCDISIDTFSVSGELGEMLREILPIKRCTLIIYTIT